MGLRLLFALVVVLQLPLLPHHSDAAPPPPPVLLPGFPMIAGDRVIIAWSPVPGAASYKVYTGGMFLAATAGSAYAGSLPASAGEFRFQVTAVSKTGEESQLSAPGTLHLRKIAAPTDIRSSLNPDQPSVMLAWTAVREAFAYNVYRIVAEGDPALVHSGVDPYFRDRTVKKGARYGYAVAGIDRFGREGERSLAHAVEVPAEPKGPPSSRKGAAGKTRSGAGPARKEKRETKRAPAAPDASFREVLSLEKIDNVPLGEVTFLGPGADNVLWVVRPGVREVHAMDRTGAVVTTLGPVALDAAGKGFVPHKLGVGPDGRLVVSDAVHGRVACFDRHGALVWSRKIDPPPASESRVWEGFPQDAMTLPSTPSSVLVLPEEILVTDQRFQLIYRLGHGGDLRGYITHYRKGPDTWRLRRVGELEAIPGKGVLLTFPLVRRALLVDETFTVISEIPDSPKDRAARFLAVHGVRFIPGKGVLLTDPMAGTFKLYDPETGEHLQDLAAPAFTNPNMAVWERDERIWVYLARQNRIAVLARNDAGK